ncbi:MAG TPA: cupin domain-containing protein [Bryobacteraceae bacterium]
MKRREIMTAALTWAVLDEASVLHASSVPASRLVVVGAGADRWGNPLRAGGFGWVKVSSKDTGGAWSMFESPVAPQGGVPLHVHPHQEEWFQVLEGEFLFEVGGEQRRLISGMSILGPRQVPHRWKNTGTSIGKLLFLVQPAGWLEECFAALSQLPENQRRDVRRFTEILAQHDIQVVGPPLP